MSLTFFFTVPYLQCHMFLSVLCYYITAFDYDGKNARDLGLTFRCHLSNIIPSRIFNDSMGWGMTLFF